MDNLLAVIYMNLGPYHLARMESLAALHPRLLVIEIGAEQRIYPWQPTKKNLNYHIETLFDKDVGQIDARSQRLAVKACLQKYRPKAVVVSGYTHPGMIAATRWAKKKGLPHVLLFVSTALDHPRFWWRECFKRLFLRGRFSHFAVAGHRSFEYARNLGMPKDKISVIGNVVDNGKIMELAGVFRSAKATFRKEFSLPENFFLYVGRLSREKNVVTLVDAFSDYLSSGGRWDLVIIGSGPDETILKNHANSKVKRDIHFLGWKQFDELIAHYALANALILPSLSETWGLVVNEAMCCGLPVLVSRNCGCEPELCHDGVNGFTFDPLERNSLTQSMLRLSSGKFDVNRMGKKSVEIISSHTTMSWAQGLLRAVEVRA